MTSTPRRTTRLRPIHVVLSLLLALAGVVAIGGPAQATADTVEGTVTTPLTAGINVYLSQDLNPGSGPAFDGTTPTTTTDGTGYFGFTSVADGDYILVIDGGDDWVQSVFFVNVAAPAEPTYSSFFGTPTPGPLFVDLAPGVAISGTVKDVEAPYNTLAGITVYATGSSNFFPIFDWLTMDLDYPGPLPGAPLTGLAGTYKFVVPLDDEYELSTIDLNDNYGIQNWDHHNVGGVSCSCDLFDPIPITDIGSWPHLPLTGKDFDLLNMANWVDVGVSADDLNGDPQSGVLIHLDRKTGPATWDLDIDTELTDVDGDADVFALGDGDYRLRYSVAGVFKAVHSWSDNGAGPWPLFDSGATVQLDGLVTSGCACAGQYSEYDIVLTFHFATSGGSTPGTPRKPHTTFFGSFAAPTATPTPTPTPTPTSSPSPSSSPSGSPSPSETPRPIDAQPLDFTWVWWLLVLLILGIVITIIVIIRRR